ncbi:MAG: hypothetical protein AB7D29_09670 [Campylobacterales bacterium]
MADIATIANELKSGKTVLYIGMGIFSGYSFSDGSSVPHDSDSIILAMNDGRPMAPRLMYEYARAAMSMEQSRGRKYLEEKLKNIYKKEMQKNSVHALIEKLMPRFVIDTNYDETLSKIYSGVPHFVIYGKARIGASLDRFEIFEWSVEMGAYTKVEKELLSLDKPIIFKPMGGIAPEASLIVSDADFVDWLTEAMGGFAVPPVLKEYREGKKYLMLGLTFSKDTERMVANEITIGLEGGYFASDLELVKNCTKYLASHKMEAINEEPNSLARKLLELV